MQQVKLFSGPSSGEQAAVLEAEINAWMRNEHPHILFFQQSVAGNSCLMSFVYEFAEDATSAESEQAAEVPEVFERTMEHAELDPSLDSGQLPEAELPY